ncbi:hypothetical protein Sme01_58310 [Sphaerisporangium melleum]|uniref:Signal transduction protein n=2 Tax=Sphaerisporangium melleum TaxID=321316 RepID=A0A917VKQ3_9ACTN|nr:CBS domain-containing protein [Sphaerisporangium melleum]GGK94028.1 hypothetical protein GCM10007964_40470 [Sphaerisporangium melleum]GII73355.1 hypothetical protein Sme01_58310 [Sphaerisporangium melleum]
MEVRQVMGRAGIAVRQDAPFSEIVATMKKYAVGAVAVIDLDRRPVGVVSEDDLLLKETGPASTLPLTRRSREERRKADGLRAGELMTAPAITVTPGTSLRDAARLMHEKRIKQLPVIDPVTGRIEGTVHQSDLLRVFQRPAAELRDDVMTTIRDETGLDPERLSIDIADGVVTIAGEAEHASQVSSLVEAIRQVEGVVAVIPDLTSPVGENDAIVLPLL